MEETKRSGMSKDQFWNLIEKAKEVCGTDLDASAVWIKQQLFYMTPEDVLQFHNLVYSYRDAAYKYGLWTAAGIMMEAGCSDDSFSALDMKTDAALRRALETKTEHTTVIIVAQRISTILHADQILVLDDGKIVGKGTHEELLHNCEVYEQIARSQLSAKELGLSEEVK